MPSTTELPSPAVGGGGAPAPASGRRGVAWRPGGGDASSIAGRFAVIGGFIAMVIIFGALEPNTFLTWATAKNVLDQSAVPVIIVCGLTFVLVVGEFDLSFTATIGVVGGIAISLMATSGWSMWAAIVVALVVAAIIGLMVGLLVTLGRASSFIVTLAIGSAVTGLEQAITGNKTIYQGIPAKYGDLASNSILGLRLPVWIAFVILAMAIVLLHGTRFGRHAKAVGGNPAAAYLAGVRVRRIKVISFILVAVLAGLAAIILTSRAVSYYPNAPAGFLLNTYAAAFLGAAIGARNGFTVAGSALGVVWLTTLQTGLTLNDQPAWTSNFIQGLVLAAAVLIASRGRRVGA